MAGLPLYGQSFTLADPAHSGLGAAVLGRGEAGEYTRAGGFLAYYEICQLLQEGGWTQTEDSDGNPYIYKVDNMHTHALHYATTRSI